MNATKILARLDIDDELSLASASRLFDIDKDTIVEAVLKSRNILIEKECIPGLLHINWISCTYFNMNPDDVRTIRTRKAEYLLPKHIAMYIAHVRYKYTYETIAEFYNLSQHSTILKACEKVENLMSTEEEYKLDVEKVTYKVTNDEEREPY